ncbi:MAG: hypothetical protein JRN52_11645 [Nitrososphaerota archaeon]|nr:hypothetical protein [Nitrososphaerota archaeon]
MNQNANTKRKLFSWAIATSLLLPLLFLGIPAVSASTVNITLNPTTHVAQVEGVSTTKIVLTYPANSDISKMLNETKYSMQVSGNIPHGDAPTRDFEDALRNYTSTISVENISASLSTKATANSTALVITRDTNLTAYVTGIYNSTNGTLMANMNWKSFRIDGSFVVPMDGQEYDLNMMGSAALQPLGDNSLASAFLIHAFGEDRIWSQSTIDFSALNTPLTNWTRHYDSATNTTTFSKTVNTQANFSASVSVNGQEYSISMVHDPSSTIKVLGYASASGNSLIISPAPSAFSFETAALAALVVVIILASAYMAIRWRSRATSAGSSTPSLSV